MSLWRELRGPGGRPLAFGGEKKRERKKFVYSNHWMCEFIIIVITIIIVTDVSVDIECK